nr:MAG TPA: hypothetical protein [Caudoviricetes sp.]DAT10092.1 MAG TPA: hypothetical protein [Caudoviricetes sp.]
MVFVYSFPSLISSIYCFYYICYSLIYSIIFIFSMFRL